MLGYASALFLSKCSLMSLMPPCFRALALRLMRPAHALMHIVAARIARASGTYLVMFRKYSTLPSTRVRSVLF